MDRGVDLSHYNAVSDANALRAAGYSFAWCKATQGTGTVDASFAGKVSQLRAAGLVVGAYHYLDSSDPAAQARHFAAVAGAAGCLTAGSLVPMLDMEDTTVRGTANPAVTAFYDALGAAGLDVYGNLDWWENVLRPVQWGGRDMIGHIARYTTAGNPGYANTVLGVQQYSDTGSVPGIPGAVDLNCTLGTWSLTRLRLGGPGQPLPSPPTSAPAPAPNTADTWTVEAGNTLSRIAAAWGVTVSALAATNGIPNPDVIYIGQVIHRPGSAFAGPAPVAGSGEYIVRAGDTLSAIAAVHGTTVAVLVALNHIANPDRISVGEVLHLPAGGPATPTGATHSYTVLPGDTLGVIAARLHYPGGWPALAARNHITNPNLIKPGETLVY